MKLISGFFPLFLLFSCHSPSTTSIAKNQMPFPRAVHNACTGKWAVLSDSDIYQGIFSACPEERYFGKMWNPADFHQSDLIGVKIPYYYLNDSGNAAGPGYEFTFDDSLTAMKIFLAFCSRCRSQIPKLKDTTNQQISDSIFKCQHTYQ